MKLSAILVSLLVQIGAIMKHPCTLGGQLYSSRMLLRSRIFVCVGGTLAGISSLLAACSSPVGSNPPNPQPTSISFTDADLKNYAKTVLAIEPIRQSAYNEIQQMSKNGETPSIACHQPNSLGALPKDIQNVAVNYCTQSKKIGESNGLTISRFNAMTVNAQFDPELQKQIQNELIRLQQ